MDNIKANPNYDKIRLVKQNTAIIKLNEVGQKGKKIKENNNEIKLVINKNESFILHPKCLERFNKEKIINIIQ